MIESAIRRSIRILGAGAAAVALALAVVFVPWSSQHPVAAGRFDEVVAVGNATSTATGAPPEARARDDTES